MQRFAKIILSQLILVAAFAAMPTASIAQDKVTYDDQVKTILRQRCASCHSPNSKKGDLDITSFTNLMLGGSSGSVIEPGSPDDSYLFNLVTHEDEPVMPPSGKIPDAEIEVLRKWIELGALENKGSKAVIKKVAGVAMGENPLVRPQVVATLPRMPLQPVQTTPRSPVARALAASPWAPMVAVAGKNQVLIYDTRSLQLLAALPFPEGSVNVVKFSRSGAVLLAAGGRAGASGVAVLWDVQTGERITTVGDEADEILAADITPDHELVAVGGSSRLINVYSVSTGEKKFSIKKHTDWVTAVAFSTDGVLLATGDRNGGLHVWESWTAREYLTLKGHSGAIQSIAWRADSNILASASMDANIGLWELNNGARIRNWAAHGGGVNSIAFNRAGQILSAGVDRNVRLWGQDGKQIKAFTPFKDIALSVAWCDEAPRVIAGDFTGTISAWNPADGKLLGTLTPNPPQLQQRMAIAEQTLKTKLATQQPLATAAQTAIDNANKFQAAVDQSVVAKNEAQKRLNSIQASMAQTNQQSAKLRQQLGTVTKQLDELTTAKPLLAESLEKLRAASAALPSDEAMKQQITVLAGQVTNMDAKIQTITASKTATQAKLTEVTSQVQATDSKVKSATGAFNAAEAKLAADQKALQPAIAARDQAVAARDLANAQLAAAQANVQKWKGELEFVALLTQLRQQLDVANAEIDERQKGLVTANTELKAAQDKSNAAAQAVQSARTAAQEVQAQIDVAKKK